MNIAAVRTAVADAYPRRGWRKKVMQMSDEQIFGIYKSMERDGRLFKHSKKKPASKPMEDQMTKDIQKKMDNYDRAVEKVLQLSFLDTVAK